MKERRNVIASTSSTMGIVITFFVCYCCCEYDLTAVTAIVVILYDMFYVLQFCCDLCAIVATVTVGASVTRIGFSSLGSTELLLPCFLAS